MLYAINLHGFPVSSIDRAFYEDESMFFEVSGRDGHHRIGLQDMARAADEDYYADLQTRREAKWFISWHNNQFRLNAAPRPKQHLLLLEEEA